MNQTLNVNERFIDEKTLGKVDILFQLITLKYKIRTEDIKSGKRQTELVKARKFITAILIECLENQIRQDDISFILSKDHSSVVHYKKTHAAEHAMYKKYRAEYEDLKTQFKNIIETKKDSLENTKNLEKIVCLFSQAKELRKIYFLQKSYFYWFSNEEHYKQVPEKSKTKLDNNVINGIIYDSTYKKYSAFTAEEMLSKINEEVIISKNSSNYFAYIVSEGIIKEGKGETLAISVANLIINNHEKIKLFSLEKETFVPQNTI